VKCSCEQYDVPKRLNNHGRKSMSLLVRPEQGVCEVHSRAWCVTKAVGQMSVIKA
jgi:hypothetical protein